MEKITKKQNFENIIAIAEELGREDLVAFAKHEIELLDNQAAKARARKAEKAAEPDALKDTVYGLVTDEPITIAQIVEAIGDADVTAGKVSARLTKLFKAGLVVKSEIKIPAAEGGKARRVVGYARA